MIITNQNRPRNLDLCQNVLLLRLKTCVVISALIQFKLDYTGLKVLVYSDKMIGKKRFGVRFLQ